MTLAVAGFWLWGWIAGGIRKLFRRERKHVLTLGLKGSVEATVADGLEIGGNVLRHVEKRVDAKGENFTGIVLDLVMEEEV